MNNKGDLSDGSTSILFTIRNELYGCDVYACGIGFGPTVVLSTASIGLILGSSRLSNVTWYLSLYVTSSLLAIPVNPCQSSTLLKIAISSAPFPLPLSGCSFF